MPTKMSHNGNTCEVCGKLFAKRKVWLEHLRNVHGMDVSQLLVAGWITCSHPDCKGSDSSAFRTMEAYRRHLSSAHGVQDILKNCILRFKSMQGLFIFYILSLVSKEEPYC